VKSQPLFVDCYVIDCAILQFWHADHIRPVWEGGGECDIDNLRTLCVLCHQKVTAEQAKTRAHIRRFGKVVDAGDITAFFKPAI